MSFEVAIARCSHYDEAQIATGLAAVLSPFGGLGRFVQAGQRVLIKLNLLSAHAPEKAVTTHPALVRAVVRAVQDLGAEALIGDSPGGVNSDAAYRALLETTGIQAVVNETGCGVVNFDESVHTVQSARARRYRTFTATSAPTDADVVIALPKLKTHQFTGFTGAVKLLYGYLPGLTKVEYHLHAGKDVRNFAELLLDLYETFPPALCIMDAVVAMEGNGPAHGTPCEVGLLLASPSGIALDFVASDIIGLPPLQAPTIRTAAERGIGPHTIEEVCVSGESLAAVRVPEFRQAVTMKVGAVPSWAVDAGSWLFAARPVIDQSLCRHCGRCVESCPPGAMIMDGRRRVTVRHKACIRCYCCQELCPHGAVRVASPRLRMPTGVINRMGAIQRFLQKKKRR